MMNQESFFEKITGTFLGGTELKFVSLENRLVKSVGDHISRLFNTRRGSISHLPDYGIPDIAQLYRGLPSSFEELKVSIVNLIKKYEPRLERVQIRLSPFNPVDMKVNFVLSGYLKTGNAVFFNTGFASTGEVKVAYPGMNEK